MFFPLVLIVEKPDYIPISSVIDTYNNMGGFSHTTSGLSDFAANWVRLVLNGTNPGLFEIIFQAILAQICPSWGQSDPPWSQI